MALHAPIGARYGMLQEPVQGRGGDVYEQTSDHDMSLAQLVR